MKNGRGGHDDAYGSATQRLGHQKVSRPGNRKRAGDAGLVELQEIVEIGRPYFRAQVPAKGQTRYR